MKTIRSYANIAEAGFAQSLLEAAGIPTTLADENVAGLGPGYAPAGTRLQVEDKDAERALEILNRQVAMDALPGPERPPAEPAPPVSETGSLAEILVEIRALRRNCQVFFVLLMVLAVSVIAVRLAPAPEKPRTIAPIGKVNMWAKVRDAMDRLEYDKANDLLHQIVVLYPTDSYAYSTLGYIALVTGKAKEAETNYARAYELFPSEDYEKNLRAVKRLLEKPVSGPPATGAK